MCVCYLIFISDKSSKREGRGIMRTTEIKPGIHWVGAIDWAVRDFHGYVTPNGTTYNNYLILDTHVTLIDTVKHDFSEYTTENIRSLVDPAKIENLVINHIENDHASSVDKIIGLAFKVRKFPDHFINRGADFVARNIRAG